MHGFRGGFYVAYNPVNTVTLTVKLIITQFKMYVKKNQETGCHAYGQSDDIDQRKYPVAPEISECNFEIIPEHLFEVGN
jgi:hypothetical protein